MRKKVTKAVKPSDADELEPAVWTDSCYRFEDKESWNKSLLRCYSNKKTPKDLSKCQFVFTPDTAEETAVKTEAVDKALKHVVSLYDASTKDGKQLPPRDFLCQSKFIFLLLEDLSSIYSAHESNWVYRILQNFLSFFLPIEQGS